MNAEETPKECPGHTTYSQAKTELLVAAESRLTLLLSRLEELAKTWEAASKSATAPIEMIPANFCAAELRAVMEGK